MNNRQEQNGYTVNEKIDHSLNLLKQLETKLHNDKSNYVSFNKNTYESPSSHTRIRTEPYSFSQRNNNYEPTQFTITQKSQQHIRNTNHIPNTFSHSQPTMIEHNQNDHSSIRDIIKQNRKLKKYVNCLLQMNDYLKNQLLRKETMMVGVNKMGHSFQLQLMRMEIQYLKELNRDKELEIRKTQHIAQSNQFSKKNKTKAKYSKVNPAVQETRFDKLSHGRSVSAYQNFEQARSYSKANQRSVHNQQQNGETYLINSHRVMKSKQSKKSSCQAPTKNTSSVMCKTCKPKPVSSKDPYSKKKKQTSNIENKCRLCY